MGTTLDGLLKKFTARSAAELERKLDDGRVQCLACGHRCRIAEGNPGVCRVRFVESGELYRPHGYVGALACDPWLLDDWLNSYEQFEIDAEEIHDR